MKLLRKITAYLLLFIVWDNLDLSMAQTSGLPAPGISPPLTLSATEALFANLTGCATATYVLVPASGDCAGYCDTSECCYGEEMYWNSSSSISSMVRPAVSI